MKIKNINKKIKILILPSLPNILLLTHSFGKFVLEYSSISKKDGKRYLLSGKSFHKTGSSALLLKTNFHGGSSQTKLVLLFSEDY